MAVVTPVRPHTSLDVELRETEIRPPTAPPSESRGQPTPPRSWWWLVAILAVAALAAGIGVVLINRGDTVPGDVDALAPHYEAYTSVLGDGADEFVALQQAAIEDVITAIGVPATDQLDAYYRDYGVILLDGATAPDHWEALADAQARDHEIQRFRTMADWWSVVPDTTYGHEVDRLMSAAEMWPSE